MERTDETCLLFYDWNVTAAIAAITTQHITRAEEERHRIPAPSSSVLSLIKKFACFETHASLYIFWATGTLNKVSCLICVLRSDPRRRPLIHRRKKCAENCVKRQKKIQFLLPFEMKNRGDGERRKRKKGLFSTAIPSVPRTRRDTTGAEHKS